MKPSASPGQEQTKPAKILSRAWFQEQSSVSACARLSALNCTVKASIAGQLFMQHIILPGMAAARI